MSAPGHDGMLRLHRLHARLRLELDEELGALHGIDLDNFALLHALASEGAMTLTSLGRHLAVGRAWVLKRSRPLEKIGLIASEGALAQRRVTLSPAGRRVLKSAANAVDDVWASGLAQLPAGRADALEAALLPASGAR